MPEKLTVVRSTTLKPTTAARLGAAAKLLDCSESKAIRRMIENGIDDLEARAAAFQEVVDPAEHDMLEQAS